MKIFISYRRADSKYVVDRIRDRLITAYDEDAIFRDIESIPLGTNFSDVLKQATKGCNVMLVVIGPQWASVTDAQGNKRLYDPKDFTRIEVETALAHEEILTIPVLVMNAAMPVPQEIPESLGNLLFRNGIQVRNDPDFNQDMQKLVDSINRSQERIITPKFREYFEPETVSIPAGQFLMGSLAGEGAPEYERPQHTVDLPSYRIGKYPVKNAEYEEFVSQTKLLVSPAMGWDGQRAPKGRGDFPVMGVTWYDALSYCDWLSETTRRNYSLPNEAQWEKACRGGMNTLYPWGNEFDLERCRYGNNARAQNEYGCFYLVGLVRQWTRTLWGEKRVMPNPEFAYPWKDDWRNDLKANRHIRRVVRGCAMKDPIHLHRCGARSGQVPDDRGLPGSRYGFRVVTIEH